MKGIKTMKKTMTREEMLNNIINFDRNTNTFTLTKQLYNASCKYGSEEYNFVEELREKHPNCKIEARAIKKATNKDYYDGLDYEYMRDYIKRYDAGNTKNLSDLDALIAEKANYLNVRNWFFKEYPRVKEFGTKTRANEILGKKACKTVFAEQAKETSPEAQAETNTVEFKLAK